MKETYVYFVALFSFLPSLSVLDHTPSPPPPHTHTHKQTDIIFLMVFLQQTFHIGLKETKDLLKYIRVIFSIILYEILTAYYE